MSSYVGDALTIDIFSAMQNLLLRTAGDVSMLVPLNATINYPEFIKSISAMPSQMNLKNIYIYIFDSAVLWEKFT